MSHLFDARYALVLVWSLLGFGSDRILLAEDRPLTTAAPAISPTLSAALDASIAGDKTKAAALLEQTLAAEPDSQLARWRLGQVRWDGQWRFEGP